MKTWLYLPLLLLMGFTFSSCTKTTNEVVIPNKTIIQDVAANLWKLDDQGVYYIQFDVPELDQNTNQLDGVIVSIARDKNLYEILPEVYKNEYYNVIHQPGTIIVELRGPNGSQAAKPVDDMRFKIVIIPSNQID
ncbi:hypothetical protein [Chitinophaga sp. MM2321]|uniref:hypothetical protein n=1 Tax=Chitinophaga sp. MM2321 TaxID=3137178 RepID=UPI0032D57B9B